MQYADSRLNPQVAKTGAASPALDHSNERGGGGCFGVITKINGEIVSPCLLGHFQQATELP
jgi:hypothetical protein